MRMRSVYCRTRVRTYLMSRFTSTISISIAIDGECRFPSPRNVAPPALTLRLVDLTLDARSLARPRDADDEAHCFSAPLCVPSLDAHVSLSVQLVLQTSSRQTSLWALTYIPGCVSETTYLPFIFMPRTMSLLY